VNAASLCCHWKSFDIEVKSSDSSSDKIEVLIISRKHVPVWKKSNGGSTQNIKLHYSNSGEKINDVFKLSVSDVYAFILSNRCSSVNIITTTPRPKQLPLFTLGNKK
jgi:hypothetical protein